MVSPVIQSALSQMQYLAAEAAGEKPGAARINASVGGSGFAEELHASIVRINELQQTARSQAVALQAGDSNVSLSDVMIDSQKASIAFETGVQVRNKLVSAYKEIMNMQV